MRALRPQPLTHAQCAPQTNTTIWSQHPAAAQCTTPTSWPGVPCTHGCALPHLDSLQAGRQGKKERERKCTAEAQQPWVSGEVPQSMVMHTSWQRIKPQCSRQHAQCHRLLASGGQALRRPSQQLPPRARHACAGVRCFPFCFAQCGTARSFKPTCFSHTQISLATWSIRRKSWLTSTMPPCGETDTGSSSSACTYMLDCKDLADTKQK